ncbi:hypothetical protein GCM10010492_44480 [Saccharothrix mutabilis subsp. mutabilis]|uniref:Uncharacterized protein n=1 Tax=Saccharothrix mutabilis subsp. mutabilis TaxID=66855 RepID=A0ABN0U6N7_9PSEU
MTRRLATEYERAPGGEPGDLVELIEGGPAVRHHIAQLQSAAREEVLLIDCPPYLGGAPEHNAAEFQALRRGVVYRTIYHLPSVDDPARPAQIADYAAAGEDARALLAAGLKDAAIMRSLGMTQRTMTRRMAALPAELDATTRFQAGLNAARRGLV